MLFFPIPIAQHCKSEFCVDSVKNTGTPKQDRAIVEIVSPRKPISAAAVSKDKMAYVKDVNITRFVTKHYSYVLLLIRVYLSINPPDVDESDEGNRDPALAESYKDLVNLR